MFKAILSKALEQQMRLITFFILIYCSICLSDSQPFIPAEKTLHLTHYSTQDGLPHATVRTLIQDKQGVLWIGTNQGVALFDGLSFTLLEGDLDSPLSSAMIFDFALASDSSMWIATYQHGLFHYFPKTKSWKQYGVDVVKDGLSSPVVRSVFIDEHGIVWVGTRLGLHRLNSKIDRFEQILDPAVGDELQPNYVSKITSANNEHLWVGTAKGLVYFNKEEQSFKRYTNIKDDINSIPNNTVRDLLITDENLLWVATDNGLASMVKNSGVFNNQLLTDAKTNYCKYPLNSLIIDSMKRMWIGTYQKGLCIGTKQGNQFNIFVGLPEADHSLRSNNINDVIEDESGNIWLATHQGLSKYSKELNGIDIFYMTHKEGARQVQSLYKVGDDLLLGFLDGALLAESTQLKTIKEDIFKQEKKLTIRHSTYVAGKGIYASRGG